MMIKVPVNQRLTINEPNLIPLLDFFLVLIVMFVLLAGPIQQAIELPLPEVKSSTTSTPNQKQLLISIQSANDIKLEANQFKSVAELEIYLKNNRQSVGEITIAPHRDLEVNTLMKVFAICQDLGIKTANIQIQEQ